MAEGVLGELALEPEETDNIAYAALLLNEFGDRHARVGGLIAPVIADGGDDTGSAAYAAVLSDMNT